MKVFIVTGTPGTGKTTLAVKLAKQLGFRYIDVNKTIKKYNLSESYDKKRKTKIIDIKKLNNALIKEITAFKKIEQGIIIDSHLSYCLSKRYATLCIVTKCNLKELERRLKKKRYSKDKTRENLDAEIFDICINEAKENNHKIIIIDTTKGINIKKIMNKLQ